MILNKKKNINKKIVIVYGSGASFGSGYNVKISKSNSEIKPPTDRGFFENINDDFLIKEYKALFYFKKLYFDSSYIPGMEEVWTALDLNYKHISLDTYDWAIETSGYDPYTTIYEYMDKKSPSIRWAEYLKHKFLADSGRDFRRLIYDVYANHNEVKKEDNFKALHDLIKKSELIFLGYITFNYDCLLENSLKDEDFKYIGFNSYTKSIDNLIYKDFPIIKLHGSLNWEYKVEDGYSHPIVFYGPPYDKDKQVKPYYNTDSSWCEPAIIPPTLFKQEINDDSRKEDFLTQTILQQWRAAITILREADKIIFVGYSFPISDFHAKRIFHIARMHKSEKNIKNVMRNKVDKKKNIEILDCIGKNDDVKQKKEKLYKIFGKNKKIKVVKKDFSCFLKSEELAMFLKQ